MNETKRHAWVGFVVSVLVLIGCDGSTPDADAGRPDAGEVTSPDAGQPECEGVADGMPCGDGEVCVDEVCVAPSCQDGVVSADEDCDDGNAIDGDGCESDCTFSCVEDTDCDDAEPCDGAETCDPVTHACVPGTALADTTECVTTTITSGLCLAERCTHTFPERDFVCVEAEEPVCATTEPVLGVVERTVVAPITLSGSTLTFVIDAIALPQESDDVAAGFNLDALDSGTGSVAVDADCQELSRDFTSLRDRDHVGVDNAFQSLIATFESLFKADACPGMVTDGCLDALLQDRIVSGETLIVIEITGVDDLTYDADVMVQLFTATVPGGGPPALDTDGTLAAGQTFETVSLGSATPADIFRGRLRAVGVPPVPLTISDDELTIPALVTAPELRFDVRADALEDGQMGGRLVVDDLVTAIAEAQPSIEETVRALFENVADIGPTSDPAVCGALSIGATLSAVPAVRAP